MYTCTYNTCTCMYTVHLHVDVHVCTCTCTSVFSPGFCNRGAHESDKVIITS